MCRISLDTVARANRRTILQSKDRKSGKNLHSLNGGSFMVSVAIMGKVCSQNITAEQIKRSFSKALKLYGQKV